MKNIDAKLVIVGDGPLRESLELQAKEQGNKIIFLGAKTHEELKTIYASADIFVAPSVTAKDGDKEGIPTAIMEAMASGLPIVASNSGGICEIIEDEKNGYLVEEKNVEQLIDRINQIILYPDRAEAMQEEALKSSKEKDYRSLAKRYAKILGEL